jgi:predicted protein tyrosine phosphatase
MSLIVCGIYCRTNTVTLGSRWVVLLLAAAPFGALPGALFPKHSKKGVAPRVSPWIRYVPAEARMEVYVLSRQAAERYEPRGAEICISISDPEVPPAQLSTAFLSILRLGFNDIMEAEQPADVLFGAEHALAIVQFVEQWPQAERLVIHCHAGASRSPGVALGLCDRLDWPTAELERGYPAWNRWVRRVLAGHGATSVPPTDLGVGS